MRILEQISGVFRRAPLFVFFLCLVVLVDAIIFCLIPVIGVTVLCIWLINPTLLRSRMPPSEFIARKEYHHKLERAARAAAQKTGTIVH